MPNKNTFPKERRVRTPSEFSRVRRHGVKFATPYLYCYWQPSNQPARIGITISKRQIRLAARRNQIKRIVREWFRLNQQSYPWGDYVIIVTRRFDQANNPEIRRTLDGLLQKLSKRCKSVG